MRKNWLLGITTVMLTSVSFAQSNVTDQINALHAAEQRQQAETRAAQEAIEVRQRRQEALRAAEVRKAQQARQAAQDRQQAIANAKAAEIQAEKRRKQDYEDQLRNLALEEQKLQLQMLKTKADRANDYIDQDLRRQAAQTDVIQSQADSERNISEGSKALLQSTGEAKVKDASRWFGR